jgi:hypothetical protein
MERKQNGIQMPQNASYEIKEEIIENTAPPKAKKNVQNITLPGERFASESIVSSDLSTIEISSYFSPNVKEHATPGARANVDHGVRVGNTDEHVNRAPDRGCCVSTCSDYLLIRSSTGLGNFTSPICG